MTIQSAPASRSHISMHTRAAFGVGDLGFNLIWQGTAVFLLYFYTDVAGINPATAGLIYLIAMAWDAITDPVVATLADRTRSRMGKYRPWILAGAVPFAASYPLAFSVAPSAFGISPVWWALGTHMALRTTYTIVGVPFSALQARLTRDSHARTLIAAFRVLGATAGSLAVVTLTPIFVQSFGADNEDQAYFFAAVVAACVALSSLAFCFMTMREPDDAGDTLERRSIIADLKSIGPMFMKNPPLVRVFGIITIASICLAMFSKCVLYFFKYNLERPDLLVFALVIPAISLLVMMPLWIYLSKQTSKKIALSRGMIIALAGYLSFYLVPEKPVYILSAIALISIGGSALPIFFWSMLPDTVEYGEAKTGFRAEAKTFGFATFAQKAAVGINALLLGTLLSATGYVANAIQSPQTLHAIKLIMVGIPALGVILIYALLRGYKLDRVTHDQIVEQLEQKSRGE